MLALLAPAVSLAAAPPPFEPVEIQRIDLPGEVREGSMPVFTRDGQHLLFGVGRHLWIVGADGKGARCLTCSQRVPRGVPITSQRSLIAPFPDGKRVFFGPYGEPTVVECSPSVVDCASVKVVPIDLDAARVRGGLLRPGGANTLPGLDLGGAASPKLSPDGEHIAFSNIRSDAGELMIVADLARTERGYAARNPRVLNPPGPTSPRDRNVAAWSDSSALYEFKSFSHGGARATYVQVGGAPGTNVDVWEIDLATGRRTRLTQNPDWDEDNGPSPDGQWLVLNSQRTMRRTNLVGLLPVRSFFTAQEAAVLAAYFALTTYARQCALVPWLLPSTGDAGAEHLGQPLQPYDGGDVHAAPNLSGWAVWSPDGTAVALNTQSHRTNVAAPYLLVARLVARRPTPAPAVVSSGVGDWAPTPAQYHGALLATGSVTLRGAASGTVRLENRGLGLGLGSTKAVYDRYSDDGRNFVTGTSSFTSKGSIVFGPNVLRQDLTLTGADSGFSKVDARFDGLIRFPMRARGSAVVSFNGTTVSGIPRSPAKCPDAFPRAPKLDIETKPASPGVLAVRVTASIGGAGTNEAGIDTRPVRDATLTAGGQRATTDADGRARLDVPAGRRLAITATAGDTFAPATVSVDG